MGLIEAKTYTSAAEMLAAHAAIRNRLLYGQPIRRTLVPPPPEPEREWFLQHDAHVNARAVFLLAQLTVRVRAIPLIKEMCAAYGYSYDEICSQRKNRPLALARQKMMWVVKQLTLFSYPEIGRKFGGRDHTTAIHAIKKIDALIAANDPSVADLKGWLE